MPTYMLDTNICIYVMKATALSPLKDRFEALADEICISVMTIAELRFGAEKSLRREQSLRAIADFSTNLAVLPFDKRAAENYGGLRAELERAGTPCGLHDTQIGAHARSRDLIIVTNNRREFDRMPGLCVENWV
ncbi:MAG: VapC toxin family PIN domain ribonuclease [Bosea sp. 12-68-7]|nr:MAG: VapC toxin family PIN domain ribonuclease [Bosea sp. 12-68-7]OYX15007.1 MAG: VapC toxin family PIN domain ribonuclease [Rhizobiales bacterium 32-66-8]